MANAERVGLQKHRRRARRRLKIVDSRIRSRLSIYNRHPTSVEEERVVGKLKKEIHQVNQHIDRFYKSRV